MPRECLTIIESNVQNSQSRSKAIVSKVSTSSSTPAVSSDVAELKDMVRALILDKKNQTPAPASVKAVEQSCVTCGGVSKSDFDNYVKANDAVMQNMQNQMGNITDLLTKIANSNTASTSGSGSLPSNTIANPKGDVKAITTRSGVSYNGPQTSSPQETENEPEVTKDTVQPSTENIQPPVVQTHEPVVVPKTKPTLPYPSRANKEKFREKDDLLASKFMEIFLDKMIELTKTPVNENCSAVILKKFPEKLGDPGRFLIPCDFPEMNECLALADLGASINLMPLSIWKELSLPALTKTRMILELADRTISTPTGISQGCFRESWNISSSCNFVVVDYVADPRAPLILGRPFLRTARALIDVHGEQMTLRHDDQSVTFKVGDTKTLSYNSLKRYRVDVIDIACEEYVQEVLEISKSGNPTSTSDLTIDSRSPSFTPFGGNTVYLEELLSVINSDPNPPSSPVCEIDVPEKVKSSCEDPPDLELKRLTIPNLNHFPLPFMDQMLERLAGNEYYCFLDGFSGYFQIPIDPLDQEKTTFTCPYGTFAYRRMPFGLCNAPCQRSKGAVLGQRKTKHFQPIHYASKTMTEAQAHYTTTEKELLAVDAKPRLLRWILLLQEFDVEIRDKKGAENLAADHLSRLENPHQSELEKKEITETFPLETLGMVTFRGDDNGPMVCRLCKLPCGKFCDQRDVVPTEKKVFQRRQTLLLGRPLSIQDLCRPSN
ncbi:reverse transcriptase domain-containing protein [Tanacetum coccineum]